MTTIRTCRRCSVTRVNTLCRLYDKAFQDNDARAKKQLAQLSQLAAGRGYDLAGRIMEPGLTEDKVRPLCWNISSLLTDEDLDRMGLGGKKRS